MNQIVIIAMVSWLAGVTAFVGGVLAKLEGSAETQKKRELIHGIVAFGGGILFAAVAFALTPEGMAVLHPIGLATAFCSGGLVFCVLDAILSKRGGNKAQFMAMLMDFVPEAMALGALFGHSHQAGMLLALFIAAQNLPEGFNAYRESVASRVKPRHVLTALLASSLLGPAAACSGFLFLQGRPIVTACIMVFAAGGILYLIFQDIAPQSTMRWHWMPPLGAVFGFAVGMIGTQLLS